MDSDHGHSHGPEDFGWAFAIGTALNVALVLAQIIYGITAHSIALLADAGHNSSDVLGLILAWGAIVLSKTLPTKRYTYGLRSASILAALLNAIILLIATGAIIWEAIRRLTSNQEEVAGLTVIVVAGLAVLLNGISAWLLKGGHKDLNVRGAYLHMLADAGVSAGVVVAGLVIVLTGWNWVDPVVSISISGVIIWGTWGLLADAITLSLDAVPLVLNRQKFAGIWRACWVLPLSMTSTFGP
jgi:cobalt-zinc-cadmium efflux system protein